MGLTLHYKLRAPVGMADSDLPPLVAAMHRLARRFQQTGRVAAVSNIGSVPGDFLWRSKYLMVKTPGDPDTRRGVEVPVQAGRVFTVALGTDSEPLRLGLCRYPAQTMDHATGRSRAVRRRGWRLAGFCKTQYASLRGWEHFRRCRLAAVDLLLALRGLGLKVWIMDEGNYWPHRDETELRRNVDQMNGIVAGFAGAMRDATEGDGGAPVQSPVFAHPLFERIEAEGVAREGAAIGEAVDLVRKLSELRP